MSDFPPDWAIKRVSVLANIALVPVMLVKANPDSYKMLLAFARYIASKEEAPVDLLVLEARRIAAEHTYRPETESFQDVLEGRQDHTLCVKTARAALKRGMELAKWEEV